MTEQTKAKFIELTRQIAAWILDAPPPAQKKIKFKVELHMFDGEIFLNFWSYSKKTTANIGAYHIEITSRERWMPPEKIPAVMKAIEEHIKKGKRLPAYF